jgi:PEGA domain-containing protein
VVSRTSRAWLLGLAITVPALPAAADPPAPAPDTAPAVSPAEAEARAHFERGVALLEADAWDQALAEFLESRELFPTAKATNNAAVCLRRLERFPEALAMVESLLRDFPDLPDEARAAAAHEAADLGRRIGALAVSGGPPGAMLAVDDREVGSLPLAAPLRLNAGRHRVRVGKDWFEPYEATVDLAGGEVASLEVVLTPLEGVGKLAVVESTGRPARVRVDGREVGRTPWEGLVPVGRHLVTLEGEPPWGTQPVELVVGLHQVTSLSLRAEELVATLVVASDPPARLLLDDVAVGSGAWRGRVRGGRHRLSGEIPGYTPFVTEVVVVHGEEKNVDIALERDPYADVWSRPVGLVLELDGGFSGSPSLGGELAACQGCDVGPALGGSVTLRAGASFDRFVEAGLAVGFVGLEQSIAQRAATIQPVGLSARTAIVTDRVRLRGASLGLYGGLVLGGGPLLHLRFGAGVLVGSLDDTRSGVLDGVDVAPATVRANVVLVDLEPAIRLGYRPAPELELLGGIDIDVIIVPSPPRWDDATPVDAGAAGIGSYAAETFAGTVAFVASPVIGAAYAF